MVLAEIIIAIIIPIKIRKSRDFDNSDVFIILIIVNLIIKDKKLIFDIMDRKLREKNQTFDKNIEKRGKVPTSLTKKEDKFPVGPVLLGFFLFVVVGSALFQILNTATSQGGNSVY